MKAPPGMMGKSNTMLASKNSSIPEPDEDGQIFADISNFDIRKGICSSLMNPEPENNKIGVSIS
jgi:hypothetical protein